MQLQYYRVTAPASGIVGDLTVREGDRVTTSTEITTIDDQEGLEAYIQVPLDRAPDARVGLPVQILDAEGKVIATNPITFVAPRVDAATQTVLVKSLLRNAPAGGARPAVRPRAHRVAVGAGTDDSGVRGARASAASISSSSPSPRRRAGGWSPASIRCRSGRSRATTTS